MGLFDLGEVVRSASKAKPETSEKKPTAGDLWMLKSMGSVKSPALVKQAGLFFGIEFILLKGLEVTPINTIVSQPTN